jgi:hypothetical protein
MGGTEEERGGVCLCVGAEGAPATDDGVDSSQDRKQRGEAAAEFGLPRLT